MSDSSSDSGPKDRNPRKGKKSSKDNAEKPKSEPAVKRKKVEKDEDASNDEDEDGGGKIKIGGKRFVSINEFRGKKFIDIREYYGEEDDLKPTKKGISLSKEQFEKVIEMAPTILKKYDAE